jgi:hypothetical protein
MGDDNQCWAMGKLTAVLNGQFRPSSVSLSGSGVKKSSRISVFISFRKCDENLARALAALIRYSYKLKERTVPI